MIALFFVTCWKAPGPPWPDSEIGVIVDFGTDAEGSGEIKELTEPSQEESTQPSESTPQPSESTPAETSPSTVETYDTDSDVHEEAKTTPTPKPAETKTENTKTTETKKETTTTTTTSSSKNNNGDDNNKVGDKGDPNSKTPSHVYSGKSGGGDDGLDFKINGWTPDKKPTGRDVIKDRGVIQFEFTVDEYGDIQNLVVLKNTFNVEQTKILKERFLKVAFIQTSSGKPPVATKGTLTWKFDY